MQVTWVDFSVLFQVFDLSLPPCTGYSFKLGFVPHTILTFLYNSSHFIFVFLCKIYMVTNYSLCDGEYFESDALTCATEVEIHLVSKKNRIWNKGLVAIWGGRHICTFIGIICIWKQKFFFWSMSQDKPYLLFLFPGTASSIQQP